MANSSFFNSKYGFGAKGALGGEAFANAPKFGGGFGSLNPSIGFGSEGALTGEGFAKAPNLGGSRFGANEFLKAFASGLGMDPESKYRRQGEFGGFGRGFGNYGYGGEWSKGGGGQVLENLGVVYPQQMSPVFLPGQEGKRSQWGSIGGALLGAASGFIPGVGVAGAALGSQLGGGLGGALFD